MKRLLMSYCSHLSKYVYAINLAERMNAMPVLGKAPAEASNK